MTSAARREGPAARPPAWRVDASARRGYEIRVAEPILDPANPSLLACGEDPTRRVVVVDGGLPKATRDDIWRYFDARGCEAVPVVLDGGEASKDMATALALLERFQEAEVDRRTQPVIAIGGGAVLDTVGFAAAIYRRGIPYVRVPTTLLAYIDASVGVKTGINHGRAKNLVGAFQPPAEVLLDRAFLETQDTREFVSGLGEILKLAVGCERALLSELEACLPVFRARAFGSARLRRLLDRSIEIMLEELSGNVYEDCLTRAVDLGHTFSQPLELGHVHAPMRHGEAVAVDINLSTMLAQGRGLLGEADVERVLRLSLDLGLPMSLRGLDAGHFWDSLRERRLHRGGRQRTPLPGPLGSCGFVDDLTADEIARAVARFETRAQALEGDTTGPAR